MVTDRAGFTSSNFTEQYSLYALGSPIAVLVWGAVVHFMPDFAPAYVIVPAVLGLLELGFVIVKDSASYAHRCRVILYVALALTALASWAPVVVAAAVCVAMAGLASLAQVYIGRLDGRRP